MKDPFFSIIVVTLNAQYDIQDTINSVLNQTCIDYDVIIKDGCSKDETLKLIPKSERIRIVIQQDSNVYEGMNQAISLAKGRYLLFLNAGDKLKSPETLNSIQTFSLQDDPEGQSVIYGDFSRSNEFVYKYDRVSPFSLYRKPLCHQTIFYPRTLIKKFQGYNTEYKISADHDLTVRMFKAGVRFLHSGIVVCDYKGEGISETDKGLRMAKEEKKEIERRNFATNERIKYSFIIALTLPELRAWIVSKKSPRWLRYAYHTLRNKSVKDI